MKTINIICTSNTNPRSPMFTEGKVYQAKVNERGNLEVKDDKGHSRFLGSSQMGRWSFPMGTSDSSMNATVYKAYFIQDMSSNG